MMLNRVSCFKLYAVCTMYVAAVDHGVKGEGVSLVTRDV